MSAGSRCSPPPGGGPSSAPGPRYLGLGRGPRDLDHRDAGLAAPRGSRPGALPLGRQARVAVAGCDGRGALRGDLRGRPAVLATTLVVLVGLALPGRLDSRRLALLLRVVRRPRRVAHALRLVRARAPAARPASRRRRRSRRRRHRALVEPGHGRQREVLGHDVGDLVPAQRERDPRVGERPDGIGRGHRPVLRVLVVVEEHAVALLLPPLRGRDRGRPALDVARQRERGAPDLPVRPARLDPDVHVDPARARRLRPADEPDRVQRLVHHAGDLADL